MGRVYELMMHPENGMDFSDGWGIPKPIQPLVRKYYTRMLEKQVMYTR